MSALVDRAIDSAGLGDVLAARRVGTLEGPNVRRLREADLLALGALADLVRADEVGDEVRVYTNPPQEEEGENEVITLPRAGTEPTGLELLREVAVARVSGVRGVRVRIDWTRCGLELAQVALGFGANELVGRVVTKRGLPIADGELLGVGKKSRQVAADVVKRNELAGFVHLAGRTPLFVQEAG